MLEDLFAESYLQVGPTESAVDKQLSKTVYILHSFSVSSCAASLPT